MTEENNSGKDMDSLKRPKNQNSGASSYFSSQIGEKECDESCVHTVKQKLVRIQYPGIIKNLDKALETLGGLRGVEKGVAQNKLELNFHPKNKYNKGVTADPNTNNGLLVKIRKTQVDLNKFTWDYEIVGATVKNFVFAKFIDFQYIPLVAEHPEKNDSNVECIYDSILPKKIQDIQYVLQNNEHMPLFLPLHGFSRSDIQKKLNPVTKQQGNVNSDPKGQAMKRERKLFAFAKHKQPSIFHKFHETEIPEKPTDFISQLVGKRNYHEHLIKLETLFKERPIWTKNGLRFHSLFSNDLLKVLLPAVAYYELTGPWRCTWIRFGYDPRKDPESKKYQNLDYRIPYSLRTNLKIGTNRASHQCKVLPTSLDKLEKIKSKSKDSYQENTFTLRPNVLPSARQVFYQYCDILLPEIQIMLSRLPPPAPEVKCDPKIGWFPSSFVDQCREIVGKYIDQQAGSILRKQRESMPLNPLEDLFNSTQRCIEHKQLTGMKAEAGPSTSDDNFDVLTIYDSDSDDSTGCEQFYQENDLYELVDELDDSLLCDENQLAELNKMVNR